MAKLTQKSLSPALSHRFRWWRFRLIPVAVWILAVIIVLFLSSRKVSDVEVMGIIETQDMPVIAVRDGKIQEMMVDIFDPVQKNQTLALLEDASLRTEFLILESDLRRLRFEWEAKKDQWEKSPQAPSNKLSLSKLNELKAQLDYTERSIMKEIDKYNLARLGLLFERQKRLVDDKIAGPEPFESLKLEMESLSEIMKSHEDMLDVLKARIQEARRQSGSRAESSEDATWEKWIQAFGEEMKKMESRLLELAQKKNSVEIKAPVSGVVSRIFCKTGDALLSGNPLLNIMLGDSVKAMAYVKEDQLLDITPGSEVKVFSRIRPGENFKAAVLKAGPRMEEMPQRLWRAPSIPEWGLPVIVGNLPFDMFRPGELVEIQISNKPAAPESGK
jgi:multidrug resistance efflux pump